MPPGPNEPEQSPISPGPSGFAIGQAVLPLLTGIAGVILAAVALPLERAVAGIFLVISAVALMSLAMPWHWRRFHRGMTVVLAALLGGAGISLWAGQSDTIGVVAIPSPQTPILTSTPTASAESPTPSSGPFTTPPQPTSKSTLAQAVNLDAPRLQSAFLPNGNGSLTVQVTSDVRFNGASTLEVRFAPPGNYRDAFFSLEKLFGVNRNWDGYEFSCFLRPGDLHNSDAPWGGMVFQDPKFRHDYGADVVFNDFSDEWIEITGVVGRTGEKSRNNENAQKDEAFTSVNGLNGFAIFFNVGGADLYLGKIAHIGGCRVAH